MSLNMWSIIVFIAHLIFYTAMSFVIMTKPSISKLTMLITSWVIWMIAILWYGIDTRQIGFILLFIFQFIITLVGIIFSAERYINDNK